MEPKKLKTHYEEAAAAISTSKALGRKQFSKQLQSNTPDSKMRIRMQ